MDPHLSIWPLLPTNHMQVCPTELLLGSRRRARACRLKKTRGRGSIYGAMGSCDPCWVQTFQSCYCRSHTLWPETSHPFWETLGFPTVNFGGTELWFVIGPKKEGGRHWPALHLPTGRTFLEHLTLCDCFPMPSLFPSAPRSLSWPVSSSCQETWVPILFYLGGCNHHITDLGFELKPGIGLNPWASIPNL